MKTICLVCVLCGSILRGASQQYVVIPDHSAEEAAAAVAAQRDAIIHAPPIDPWRRFNDRATKANGPRWYRIWGRVESHSDEGITVQGNLANETNDFPAKFMLTNFPYPVADFETLTFEKSWWARDAGMITNRFGTAMHLLDYEAVWPKKLAAKPAPAGVANPPSGPAAAALREGVPAAIYDGIAADAAREFPGDYSEQVYIINEQVTAYKKLHP